MDEITEVIVENNSTNFFNILSGKFVVLKDGTVLDESLVLINAISSIIYKGKLGIEVINFNREKRLIYNLADGTYKEFIDDKLAILSVKGGVVTSFYFDKLENGNYIFNPDLLDEQNSWTYDSKKLTELLLENQYLINEHLLEKFDYNQFQINKIDHYNF